MSSSANWSDKQHEQTELTLTLPVAEALELKSVLPILLQVFEEQSVRGPEDRQTLRAARQSVASFTNRLRESLRPFDVPQPSSAGPSATSAFGHEPTSASQTSTAAVSTEDRVLLETRYGVPSWVLEDVLARRRAGARDSELVSLLGEAERGGLSTDRAEALVAELEPRP